MPYAANDGVRIYYEVEGNGPPLILVHGHTMGIPMWRHLGYVDALADQYRLILIDLRGHGKSDKRSAPEDYLPDPPARDVLAVLDVLGIERAHYFGHSYGGAVGFVLGARWGERFPSMIMASISPYLRERERAMAVLWHTVVAAGLESIVKTLDASEPLPPVVKAHIYTNDHGSLVGLCEGGLRWPEVASLLPAIKSPCLLMAGDRDPQYEGAKEGTRLIPDASFITLPGVGHLGGFVRSDLALPHVRAFLAKVNEKAPV